LRLARRVLALVCVLVLAHATASAQLSGTKTVGGASADYSTIDAAISALTTNGVSGAVTFLINGGTYTPPSGGWTLPAVTGMSATNTVTFKPASGATVTISGTTNDGTAVFTIDGGDYYIIDGSNSAGGTSRNMTIIETSTTYGAAIWMRNDADYNVVKNAILQSANGTGGVNVALGGVTVFIGQSTAASGNDSNLVSNNQIGDLNGTYRAFRAVYIYGQSTSNVNIGTKIIGNDVVNFGNSQSATYGIFVSYHNLGTIIRGNTVRMTTVTGTSFNSVFAIYCNEQLVSPSGNTANTVFDGNRIYGLQTSYTSEYLYGLYYVGDYNTNNSAVRVTNNMFSNDRGSNSTQWYGMFFSETSTSGTITIDHNSQYLGGAGSYCYLMYANIGPSAAVYHYNNAYYSTWTGSGYGLYLVSTSGWNSNNNLIELNTATSSAYTAYWNGAQQTLAAYKTAVSSQETASIGGNPQYISPSTGNLHIDPVRPSAVESRGTYIASVPTDIDGDARNTTTPDIGADEGNFNSGALTVDQPNGGETYLGGSTITIKFTSTRALPVRVEFTSDNGATWSQIGSTINAPIGQTSIPWTTPDIATTRAKIRVTSTLNVYEADTSNGTFSLLQPSVTMVSPNGGETYYEGDIATIRWTSVDVPSGSLVALDYSTNAGGTWLPMATNLPSANLPSSNTYAWSIPSLRTTSALVRVRMLDKPISDVSNATFTILKSMNLLSPVGGEKWIAGEKEYVKWSVNRVNRLNIDLSTDAGVTWTNLKTGVRSYIDSFQITVPNTPTTQALIRIVNTEQPQFTEQSPAVFSILPWAVQITSPNGGEKYELSQAVTVRWSSSIDATLRLEYTSDGVNWDPIAGGIASTALAYTFTPPAFPTKLARVRLIVEDRPNLSDASDAPFEIMEAPGISIFNPSQGEVLMRGSTYEISWLANRINTVNIEYSATGGTPGSWVRLASNIPASRGTFLWTVPSATTPSGKIRILEVGGSNIGESGLFSIVEPVASVRILRPNGGETYTVGDAIPISWTAAVVTSVTLQYSDDGGASWRPIAGAAGLPASQGTFMWTASAPGNGYRVRVMSGALYDDSDNNFVIERALAPNITVLSPNGGERYGFDSTATILWTSRDLTGDVTIELSLDGGATWRQLGTAPIATGSYRWNVPATATTNAIVRVGNGTYIDSSDSFFEIFEPIVPTITVLTPNNNEVTWTEGDSVDISWQSTGVGSVDIAVSTDGGATWGSPILRNVPAAPGVAGWRVPHLADSVVNGMMVRISESTSGSPSDISDGTFMYRPAVASTGASLSSELRLLGIFPNPVASSAEIRWVQRTGGTVGLAVVDEAGRIVARADLGRREAGSNAAVIDAATLAAGVYHYELRVGSSTLRGSFAVTR
jgi:hypothetical protein